VLSAASKTGLGGGGGGAVEAATMAVGAADLGNKFLEHGSGKSTIGNNGKLYPRGFRGNQYN